MIRILITDDHQIVRDGIKLLLKNEEDIEVIAEASSGQEALGLLKDIAVDIVLLDINMPGLDGLKASAIIHEKYPTAKVIILTMYREMQMVEDAFKKGAKAYLLKSCGKEELLSAIRRVSEGDEYLEHELREDFGSHLTQSVHEADYPTVSKREKEILQLISEEMTTSEIAEKLYISITTVETHRKNMLKKLGLRNTAGLMRYAFEHSLVD